jgi:hypothetical protein
VHGQLVRQQVTAAGGLDRVDIADEVGDGHVGCRELLHVTLLPPKPRDGGCLPAFLQQLAGVLGDRSEWIVVDLAPRDDGDPLVQETGELPQQATLGLAPEAQQDEVVPGQEGVDDLGENGVFVANDAGEQRLLRLQPLEEIAADFLPYGASPERSLRPAAVLQFS